MSRCWLRKAQLCWFASAIIWNTLHGERLAPNKNSYKLHVPACRCGYRLLHEGHCPLQLPDLQSTKCTSFLLCHPRAATVAAEFLAPPASHYVPCTLHGPQPTPRHTPQLGDTISAVYLYTFAPLDVWLSPGRRLYSADPSAPMAIHHPRRCATPLNRAHGD